MIYSQQNTNKLKNNTNNAKRVNSYNFISQVVFFILN
jgi:hypothetical protein